MYPMQNSIEHNTINNRQVLDILNGCQQEGLNTPQQSLYMGTEQESLLTNYIQAALNALETKPANEAKNQFDARVRAQRGRQNTLKQEFISRFSGHVVCDELGDPIIFSLIQKQVKLREKQNKIERIQDVFSYSTEQLNTLQNTKFQQLYVKAENAIQQLEAVTNVIGTLCERAGMEHTLIVTAMEHNLPTEHENADFSIDPLEQLEFSLVVPNEAIGYSIHNLLVIAGVYPNAPFAGNSSGKYKDPMIFKLNYHHFSMLQRDLGDLTKWYRDFENVLSALFSSDVAQYVKTGCKPLLEAVRTELGRKKEGLSLLMTDEVRERFGQHQDDLFLLLGQCAIDLTNHPHRDDMRQLLIEIYTLCNLKDSKNEAKTFVKDAENELTYISLLNVVQIREIYNEIIALSELSKSAHDMGFPSVFAYAELMGAGDIKQVYFAYLQETLLDICLPISFDQGRESLTEKRRRIEQNTTRLFPAPTFSQRESFSSIQQRFHVAIQAYLNQNLSIRLSPAIARPDLTPTTQEKNALLNTRIRSFSA